MSRVEYLMSDSEIDSKEMEDADNEDSSKGGGVYYVLE